MDIPEIILSVQFSVKLHSKIKQGYLDNQSRSMQLTIIVKKLKVFMNGSEWLIYFWFPCLLV